ncbi:hypothetical protein FKP32DRAFT_1689291 [Trametes sanguinea]|nr:hypothetical protein FKP32DRAFT_1689291 [Trametes sanguinea]
MALLGYSRQGPLLATLRAHDMTSFLMARPYRRPTCNYPEDPPRPRGTKVGLSTGFNCKSSKIEGSIESHEPHGPPGLARHGCYSDFVVTQSSPAAGFAPWCAYFCSRMRQIAEPGQTLRVQDYGGSKSYVKSEPMYPEASSFSERLDANWI